MDRPQFSLFLVGRRQLPNVKTPACVQGCRDPSVNRPSRPITARACATSFGGVRPALSRSDLSPLARLRTPAPKQLSELCHFIQNIHLRCFIMITAGICVKCEPREAIADSVRPSRSLTSGSPAIPPNSAGDRASKAGKPHAASAGWKQAAFWGRD